MSAAPTCTAVPVKSGSTPRPPGSSGPGASMAHVKKVLGHVSERMSESYVLIAGTQVEPTSPESPTACIKGNAVKLGSRPVEDIYLRRGVVFDDLVVGVFDVGVADGDSADHSRTGSEAAFR